LLDLLPFSLPLAYSLLGFLPVVGCERLAHFPATKNAIGPHWTLTPAVLSKATVLTGNKTLARQMEQEANTLGIPAVRMEGPRNLIPAADKRKYQRKTAVAIMNYWVYFNQNPVIDPADLLIMDDAHLAEHCLHSLYSIEIDRFKHPVLFGTLANEIGERFPEYTVVQDARDPGSPSSAPTELFSFIDQSQVVNRLREIIDAAPEANQDTDLRFRWERWRNRIEESNIYMSHRSFWFRPAVYPLVRNEYYYNASQCIYMSATIGATPDLARRLGTRPINKISIPDKYAASTYGRRMIVMNKIEDADIPDRLARAIFVALKVHPKSVWLCASATEADRYREAVRVWLKANGFEGHPMWTLTSLGDEIDQFKRAPAGHLFVAGRFDGMDFNADECRLVVLATLPRAINAQEEFFSAYLRDATFMLERLNQRVVQALGRCNRSADDYGIYILADRRFATHFGRESHRLGLPANIVAEIDSAEDATELDIKELEKTVTRFLKGQFTAFDSDLNSHIAAIPSIKISSTVTPDTSQDEITGWAEMFDSQSYRSAKDHFRNCVEALDRRTFRDVRAFFQWCEAKAAFLLARQGEMGVAAEWSELLEQAIQTGGFSSWFNRLRSSLNRYLAKSGRDVIATTSGYEEVVLQGFDDLLERLGNKGIRFQAWGEVVRKNLNSTKHDEYCVGLQELGRVLGYSPTRPRYDTATDCRWRGLFDARREIVTFEAKVEHIPGGEIVAKHVGQAHNQVTRAERQYSSLGFAIRGTIVTHLTEIENAASSALGEIRIIRKDALIQLWNKLFTLLSQYRDDWSLHDMEARRSAAAKVRRKLPPAGWLVRALENDAPFISGPMLLHEWP
jgi:hypothetical protein